MKIAVAHRSMAGEFGIASAVSAGTGAWTTPERLGDYFAHETATSNGAPSGLTEIKIDQGVDPTLYVAPNFFVLPARHNVAASISVEYAASDSWPGTPVTVLETSTGGGPNALVLFWSRFSQVAASGGSRWWRVSFTQTGAQVEIAELWLSQLVELGEAETDEVEARRGNAADGAAYPLIPNLSETITLGGIRSAVSLGPTRRSFAVEGRRMTDLAHSDYEEWMLRSGEGLRPFFFRDPTGEVFFAKATPRNRRLYRLNRWDDDVDVEEIV